MSFALQHDGTRSQGSSFPPFSPQSEGVGSLMIRVSGGGWLGISVGDGGNWLAVSVGDGSNWVGVGGDGSISLCSLGVGVWVGVGVGVWVAVGVWG